MFSESVIKAKALTERELHNLSEVKEIVRELQAISPTIIEDKSNEEKVKEYLQMFDLNDGCKFMIEIHHSKESNGDFFEFFLIRGDKTGRYPVPLKIAEGFMKI